MTNRIYSAVHQEHSEAVKTAIVENRDVCSVYTSPLFIYLVIPLFPVFALLVYTAMEDDRI